LEGVWLVIGVAVTAGLTGVVIKPTVGVETTGVCAITDWNERKTKPSKMEKNLNIHLSVYIGAKNMNAKPPNST
jgi:hypothetical protein